MHILPILYYGVELAALLHQCTPSQQSLELLYRVVGRNNARVLMVRCMQCDAALRLQEVQPLHTHRILLYLSGAGAPRQRERQGKARPVSSAVP